MRNDKSEMPNECKMRKEKYEIRNAKLVIGNAKWESENAKRKVKCEN